MSFSAMAKRNLSPEQQQQKARRACQAQQTYTTTLTSTSPERSANAQKIKNTTPVILFTRSPKTLFVFWIRARIFKQRCRILKVVDGTLSCELHGVHPF